jgi:sugar transferase (PEP-CTERM/EpsH1 system associated)
MNILIVCQNLPYPPDVGVKIRLFNLVKHLSDKHNISLVCYADSGNQENHLSKMKEYCESIILVQRKIKSKVRQLPGVAKNLFLGLPWSVKYAKSKEMQDAILKITKSKFIDVIHIDDIYMASNVDLVSGGKTKKAVTFHDIDSVRYRRTLKIEKNPYERLIILLKWLTIKWWESKIAENFDLSIVVSSIDRRLLESRSVKAKIAVIPNGVDTESFRPLPLSYHQDYISFFGNMDYGPNRDAALYFCRRIFPIIKSRLPEAKFLIVGRDPSEELRKLSSDPNIIVTGYVASVIPYYERSSVVVVPLRAGGGTRGKILEAMALGRPVVSTSLGAEGLEVTHKENIMIADRPEDFATITVELMRNGSFKSVLIESARKFVESYHSWRKIAGELDRVYRELCMER